MGFGRGSGKSNVAHLWVSSALDGNEVKPLKKNTGESSNFFWSGDTIYSYGRHFPIARAVTLGKGKSARRVVLFTRRTYSVTTAGHISTVRGALRGSAFEVYEVADPTSAPDKATERAYYEKAIAAEFDKATRSRAYALSQIRQGLGLIAQGNALSKAFKLGFKLKAPANLKALTAAAQVKHAAAEVQRAERSRKQEARWAGRRALREAQEAATQAFIPVYLEAWKRGEDLERPDGVGYFSLDSFPTVLRLHGGVIQTSRGAEVSIEAGLKALRFSDGAKQAGQTLRAEDLADPAIGDFSLREARADGSLVIGCHTIEAAELDRFRAVLEAAVKS